MQPHSSNEFSRKIEIEALLDNMLLQRDIFRPNVDIDIWKSAYFSIYGLAKLVNNQLQQKIWHGTDIESDLKSIKRTTNRFVRQIRKRGKIHGTWCGSSSDCNQILHQYQKSCAPALQNLVDKLETQHPLRKDIEDKLPQLIS